MEYENGMDEKEIWAQLPEEKNLKETEKNPTGFFIFNPLKENIWLLLIITLALISVFIYKKRNK